MHACIDNTALLIRLFTSMRIHLQVATSYTLVLQQTHDILVAIRVLQRITANTRLLILKCTRTTFRLLSEYYSVILGAVKD